MGLDWLYKLSDWNPQFFREVKGRVKLRSLLGAAVISLLGQIFILAAFSMDLPDRHRAYHHRCISNTIHSGYPQVPACVLDELGNPIVNWQGWWADVFQSLSWTLPFLLLIAGAYLLINDLSKEERRGTLNFIRLSPQQSGHILLGKLLGVPIVPFLVVLLAIPLHLMAALLGGISVLEVLSFYLVTIAVCSFFYTASLLFASLPGAQGWSGALFIWFSYSFFMQIWYSGRGQRPPLYLPVKEWFHLPIGENLEMTLGLVLVTLGIGTFWLWQAANRRFRNPSVTLLSKRQSYFATLSVECFLAGFCFHSSQYWIRPIETLSILLFLNLLWFGALIAALSPQRQALLDWARYRRERVGQGKRFWSRSILVELTWGEKSPALLAIGLNLLIGVVIFATWILTWNTTPDKILRVLLSLVFALVFVLICAAIAQILLFLPSPKRTVWATSAISSLITLPPIAISILTSGKSDSVLWLFSVFALYSLEKASVLGIAFSLVSQFSILVLLTARLSRQLQKAGESDSKALLAGA